VAIYVSVTFASGRVVSPLAPFLRQWSAVLLKSLLTFRSAPLFGWHALVVMPVVGLVLGLIGPFGSYAMDLTARVAHFVICVTLIGTLSQIVSYLVARQFFLGYWPLWASLCVDMALAVPAAGIVYGSLLVLGPQEVLLVRFVDLIWQNALLTLVFRAASLTVSWLRIRDGQQVPEVKVTESVAGLSERLPRGLRREPILAVSAEDHYLRVHTPKGEALIHMTLAEAVAVLPQGFQVHRSHWVSAQAVKTEKGDRVELVTGFSLPVSRHRKKAFAEWLDQVT